MKLPIQITSEYVITVEVNKNDTIGHMKSQIRNKTGLSLDDKILQIAGSLIENNDLMLVDLNVLENNHHYFDYRFFDLNKIKQL